MWYFRLFAVAALAAMIYGSTGRTQVNVESYSICSRSDVIQPPLSGSCTPVSTANPLPVSASVSASISGFTAVTTGTPISVTTGGNTGTLPAGAVVVATNVGTTNGAYCALGASATTSSQYIAPNGGWFAFTVGASTQLTCITSTSTTTVNMTGGAGLPTGTGGGGAGGSGGTASNFGSAFPTPGTAVGFYDGTNMVAARVGAIANATAATNAVNTNVACQYNASPLTVTDTRYQGMQCDVNGFLKVNVASATGVAQAAAPSGVTGSLVLNIGSGATGGLTQAPKVCDLHAFYTGSDNGSKTLVAGVSGRKTYICGWLLSTGADATTLTLYKGTDADCATSGAAIGPGYVLAANDRVGVNSPTWNGFVTATNADYVCINASAGNAHTAEIWYTIQ